MCTSKSLITGLSLMACIGWLSLLTACSKIADNERLIYVEPAPVSRCVLIEDHTGQHCPNCPDATAIIHELQQTYGEQIIPVAIHSERQGIMEPEGLGTALGNTYYKHWNIEFKPAGLINRLDGGDGRVLDKTVWIYAVQYALALPTPLDIRIAAGLNADDASLMDIDIDVVCTAPDTLVAGKLQVWITEDSIRAVQDNMGTIIPDYVHNHVLRASANGDWGDDVTVGTATPSRHFNYKMPIADHWKPENLSVVAFVYTDEEVMQAAQKEIIHTK